MAVAIDWHTMYVIFRMMSVIRFVERDAIVKYGFFRDKNNRKRNQWFIRDLGEGSAPSIQPILASLDDNDRYLMERLGKNMDFQSRNVSLAGKRGKLYFILSLTDQTRLVRNVILPLQLWQKGEGATPELENESHGVSTILDLIEKRMMEATDAKRVHDLSSAIGEMFQGRALLLLDGEVSGFLIALRKVEARGIESPEAEHSVVGPRESFVEKMETNLGLIRQTLRDPHLVIESVHLDWRGRNELAVIYLSDLANPELVAEVKRRLTSIVTDAVRGQMFLQELLSDNVFSPFPQMRPSERPDVTCAYLLEGSVAILIPGSSHALLAPVTMFQLMDTVDDYYSPWQYATLIRFLRILSLLFSLAVPGLYLSLVAYNPELIPTRLVISMDTARIKVALPIFVEILVMEIMIEILREAGIKLPKPIGQSVSIVGGLVIGEAAVNANLVSPVTVVIVALTAISSFTAPVYLLGITYRILRFFLLLLSSVLGLYGFLLGLFVIHAHLCRLTSFGVPYLAPLSPLRFGDWKDTLVRFPFSKLTRMPLFTKTQYKSKTFSQQTENRQVSSFRKQQSRQEQEGGPDETS